MPDFMTESEIEDYLQMETRRIPGPDGEPVMMTAMRSFWVSMECIETLSSFTTQDIVDLAKLSMKEMGHSFDDALKAVVSFTHKELAQRGV